MLGLTRIEFLDLLGRSGVGFLVELDEEPRTTPAFARPPHPAEQAVSAGVSDSSPLNYLALLSDFDLLRQVYRTLVIPPAGWLAVFERSLTS